MGAASFCLKFLISSTIVFLLIVGQLYLFIEYSPAAKTEHYAVNLTQTAKPKTTKIDGRLFAFDEYSTKKPNDTEATHTVFIIHGHPGSRLFKHPNEAEIVNKIREERGFNIRIIRIDRPGFGYSARLDDTAGDQALSGFVNLFKTFQNRLNQKQQQNKGAGETGAADMYSIIGFSMGGVYALGLSADAELQKQLHKTVLLAPFGDKSEPNALNGMCEEHVQIFEMIDKIGFGAYSFLWKTLAQFGFITHHEQWRYNERNCLTEDDSRLISKFGSPWHSIYNDSYIETYRQGTANLVDDVRVNFNSNNFKSAYSKIKKPLSIYHSKADIVTSIEMSRNLKKRITGAELHEIDGLGHYSTFDQYFETVLRDALPEGTPQVKSSTNESAEQSKQPVTQQQQQQEQKEPTKRDEKPNGEENNEDKQTKQRGQLDTASTTSSTKSHRKVIVVGGGLAGLSAALEAAKNGAEKVYIIEKEARLGGNSAKASSGINGLFSKAQETLGVHDSAALFIKDTLNSGKGKSNPKLVDVLVNSSTSAIQFLQENGVNLDLISMCGGHSQPRTHRAKSDKNATKITNVGSDIMNTLERAVRGTKNIEIMTSTKVIGFLADADSNTVQGVQIQSKEGDATELRADAVILATGGFGANRELLAKYAPSIANLPTTNGAWTTGDGLTLIQKALPNAALIDMEEIQIHPTCLVDPKNLKSKSLFLGAEALRAHGGILVNHQGERFVNELGYRDAVSQAIFKNCKPATEDSDSPCISFLVLNQQAVEEFGEKAMSFYASKGFVNVFANMDEFCTHFDVNAETLKKTIESYNQAAQQQSQDAFGKTTFPTQFNWNEKAYVMRITPGIHYTMGGLQFNEKSQVLTQSGSPIHGLFAAGEVTGGLHGKNRLAGNSLLECVVFGRIAGQQAVSAM